MKDSMEMVADRVGQKFGAVISLQPLYGKGHLVQDLLEGHRG